MSLDLILGYGALVSFGHAAFLGIGAYAVGILSSHGVERRARAARRRRSPPRRCSRSSPARSRCARKGVYFIMITLAFGQMLFFLATSLAAYGGDDGLTLADAQPRRSGRAILGEDRLPSTTSCLALPGRRLRASAAPSSPRASAGCCAARARTRCAWRRSASSPFAYQLAAYVIAGMIAGSPAACLANQTEFVSPAFMTWQRSGELIFMVVLGGLGSLHGAIIGAAAFLLLEEFLSRSAWLSCSATIRADC